MNIATVLTITAITIVAGPIKIAHANNVGFANVQYDLSTPQITMTFDVTHDFTDFPMFGGGLDLVYDPDVVTFVSYMRGPLAADASVSGSPSGQFIEPGLFEGFGIGTLNPGEGMNSVGTIGSFVFEILQGPVNVNTPCGLALCLQADLSNPFVSLFGQDVTDELLANGVTALMVNPPAPVPVPGAFWMMLGAIGVFQLKPHSKQ